MARQLEATQPWTSYHWLIIKNTILSLSKAANHTALNGYEKSSEEMQFNMPGKRSAADYTQIGHGITDGALRGMDVSEAWKLANKSAVNYTPAALEPHVCPL